MTCSVSCLVNCVTAVTSVANHCSESYWLLSDGWYYKKRQISKLQLMKTPTKRSKVLSTASGGFKGAGATSPWPDQLVSCAFSYAFLNVKSNLRMHQNPPVSGKNSFFSGEREQPLPRPHPLGAFGASTPIIKFWIHHWALPIGP